LRRDIIWLKAFRAKISRLYGSFGRGTRCGWTHNTGRR
jgi:hypothetical protein